MAEYVRGALKRIIDVVAAAILLLALLPMLVLIACLVRWSGPGPIIYRGLRVGRDGRPFRILKFRSMSTASALGSEITIYHDPRVTRIGRVLRATKLDELPQLINVLRGDMSFVGPRPESPRYLDHYTREQREILRVRPGITGVSQVAFRSEEELLDAPDPEQQYVSVLLPAKLAMDLAYVRQHTLLGDFKIILLTLWALVRPITPSIPTSAHAVSPAQSVTTADKKPQAKRPSASVGQLVNRVLLRRIRSYGVFVILDALTVTIAFEVAVTLRFMDSSRGYREALAFLLPSIAIGVLYAIVSYGWGLHRRLWRYASVQDGFALGQAVALTMVIVIGVDILATSSNVSSTYWYARLMRLASAQGVALPPLPLGRILPLGVVIGGALLSLLFLGCVKLAPRVVVAMTHASPQRPTTRMLLVGAGQAGAVFVSRMMINSAQGYRLVACVDDNSLKWGRKIHGVPVVGSVNSIPYIAKRYAIDLIAIATPSARPERISEIIALCQQTTATIKIVPGLGDLITQTRHPIYLRDINVADALGREVAPVQPTEARELLRGKTILVTGAAGSIGSELCRQLLDYEVASVIALDTNETGLFDLDQRLRTQNPTVALVPWLGDIMDTQMLSQLFAQRHPDVIFHAAAYKHVPLLEQFPYQAIRTNVFGTLRLCRAALGHRVSRFVLVSTDKAAVPVNTYGATKTVSEMIVQAFANASDSQTHFCAVRFGNVIGSRGSVVPLFSEQIDRGGPITLTDPNATRYFMTIPEACGLVIAAAAGASGGLYLLDMGSPVRIADLAEKMIRARGLRVGQDISIVTTGLRSGERLHETLVSPEEELERTQQPKISRIRHHSNHPDLHTLLGWLENLEDAAAQSHWDFLSGQIQHIARSRFSGSSRTSESPARLLAAHRED